MDHLTFERGVRWWVILKICPAKILATASTAERKIYACSVSREKPLHREGKAYTDPEKTFRRA